MLLLIVDGKAEKIGPDIEDLNNMSTKLNLMDID